MTIGTPAVPKKRGPKTPKPPKAHKITDNATGKYRMIRAADKETAALVAYTVSIATDDDLVQAGADGVKIETIGSGHTDPSAVTRVSVITGSGADIRQV